MNVSTLKAAILKGGDALDLARAGAKGAVLADLAESFPVPPFIVVPTDAFDADGLRPDVRGALAAEIAVLGVGPFAVRSSGAEEDGAAAAHAGQFESLLNIPAARVEAAVERVWRSGFSARLGAYRRAHGLTGAPKPPAVMIQGMIAADSAGVAFTADPVSGDRDVTVISATRGLGDRLASGEADGDTCRIHRSGAWLDGAHDATLTDAQALAVADLACRVERRYGAPQDIEWAFEGGRLYLLQSRPITALPSPARGETGVWDNANIVESYPGVVSPFTYSFAQRIYGHVYRAFSAMMGVSPRVIAGHRATFDTMLGRVHGRVYYNLLAWYRALSLFPGFKANRAFMEQMMGVGEPLPADLTEQIAPTHASAWAKFADRARLARVLARLVVANATLPRTIRRFNARLDAALAESDADIQSLSAVALAERFRALEAQLLERWDAPLINDFLCMIAFGASRKALERWTGAEGLALHADVMIGQGDIVSAEPARLIRAMGERVRGRAALIERLSAGDAVAAFADPELGPMLDAYIARFGDRCTGELKLESLTLHEDPRALLSAVSAAARGVAEPRPASPDASETLGRLFRGKPLKRLVAAWLLAWAKARVRDRENLRFERTRLFGHVRRIVRASGRRLTEAGVLDDEDDVFLLTVEEWLGAVEGGAADRNLKVLAALRGVEMEEDAERPDPPERLTVRGGFLAGLEAACADVAVHDDGSERTRRGQACCTGVVVARVRVVTDPRTQSLEPGEILVARHTDPGWIAVFANAVGVIAERGSLLSHSAIVAREMGVPCVVALKSATSWLKTGDLVRLDGRTGRVERIGADQ
ncbi:MAG TPA: PEP/pyruvate-binding domain-containing protein [Caulobacteraceae bacterium]|nr:PEP/pyruvate-binding domain-containing protein [Caulobacteraceae bacterium]